MAKNRCGRLRILAARTGNQTIDRHGRNRIPRSDFFERFTMLLTVDNTSRIGKPVRIFDADGQEVKQVVECDTTTGHVVRFRTEGGKIAGPPNGTAIQRVTENRPAPLRVEPITTQE